MTSPTSTPYSRITSDGIATTSTEPKVVRLEITRHLVKAQTVQQVVVNVASVKQLRHDQVNVLFRRETLFGSIVVDEYQRVIDRAIIEKVVVLAFPVFVRNDIVTGSSVEYSLVAFNLDAGEFGVVGIGSGGNLVPAEGRGCRVPQLVHD